MLKSEIKRWNGKPMLFVNDEIIPACAYITYFPERNCYDDFVKAGYQIFSVNASFTSLPINARTGCALLVGIFDNPECPDFDAFDKEVAEIVSLCPNAYIFPRVNVSMPQKWVEQHEVDTIDTLDGNRREKIYSDVFRKDGGELLKQFIAHVQRADYAEHIIGYQIAGGNTQEWFHFSSEETLGLDFLNYSVVETISYFAQIAKETTERQQIVGTFYGYTMEVKDPTWGTHAMERLLDCPDIDFFCSPVSYKYKRKLGIDWCDMGAVQSIQLHRKMYFAECDIRTCLTDYPGNCRPGFDPNRLYNSNIWKGPDTVEESVAAIRKVFARQLIHGNGLWWFDMWGGWYAHPLMMKEMKNYLSLMEKDIERQEVQEKSQVALFVDETLYRRMPEQSCASVQSEICITLGQSGVPYDIYLLCDAKECERYRAVILPVPYDSPETMALKKRCEEKQIPVLQCTPEHWKMTTKELRDFFNYAGIWCYCESDDVFGLGNGYFYIHASESGIKKIRFPQKCRIVNLCDGGQEQYGDSFNFAMEQYETLIFRNFQNAFE